ncbi:glycosyltransferase [Lactobacillus helveticus]|uniref:glycosyltransferase n=1 Tax=Lactobacillus helveticus TaxID=1587 RepID=UPI002A6A9FB3|nr:glycosyltransferase [Lactobacillus helveticus]MDY1001780.1 glycosyltransferase [Lactobacillus helveticus]
MYGSIDPKIKDRLLNLANVSTREGVVFKGFYTNVWSHIKEADALVLTSKYEGLGMVLIEAAARGISLISSIAQ